LKTTPPKGIMTTLKGKEGLYNKGVIKIFSFNVYRVRTN
jgi:hypothetical protein